MRSSSPMSSLALMFIVSVTPAFADPQGAHVPATIIILEEPDCLTSDDPEIQFGVETPLTDIVDWYWNFGDGQTSDQPSPEHTYQQAGVYTVSLDAYSLSYGSFTVVQEDFVRINELIFEDDFEVFSRTEADWQHTEDLHIILPDKKLEFELDTPSDLGEQNGRIICLGPGGTIFNPRGSNGRFRFELELIDHGVVDNVSYTALRLLSGGASPAPKSLAELRVQLVPQGFMLQIVKDGATTSPWLYLTGSPAPAVQIEIDWYQVPGFREGALELRVNDPSVPLEAPPLRLEHLYYDTDSSFDTVELGVMRIQNSSIWSAGVMKIDDFRVCSFEHRPSPR